MLELLAKERALRREAACYLALAGLSAALAALWEPLAGLLLLAAGAAYCLLHLLLAARHYRDLAALGDRVDRILHGQEASLLAGSREGELAILESEIGKMTLRLREQADRLRRDKGALARSLEDIFHQIRTPLTALHIEASLLTEEEMSYSQRLHLAGEIRGQLQRIGWLVESLLKLSRIDAGAVTFRRETVPVRELIDKAAGPLQIPMELRGQTLSVAAGEETFQGDLAWTAEALGNLLKDCMEHAPAGGTVWVRAEETALYTRLVVQDDGPGFAPEDLPHLFERFYKGRGAGADSIGIGLALARRIVSEQGGTLTAGNAPEGGARFVLRFDKSVI